MQGNEPPKPQKDPFELELPLDESKAEDDPAFQQNVPPNMIESVDSDLI